MSRTARRGSPCPVLRQRLDAPQVLRPITAGEQAAGAVAWSRALGDHHRSVPWTRPGPGACPGPRGLGARTRRPGQRGARGCGGRARRRHRRGRARRRRGPTRTPGRARQGRRRPGRPAGQQREPARPEPAAGARRLPDRGARTSLPRQRVRAAGAHAVGAAAPPRRGGGPQRDLRCRRRAVRRRGGYGSSKAALEQLTAILAAEHPALHIYAVDPGDMRTRMHQDAFPGEDISDRPEPEESVPGLLALIGGELPSGRYRARELSGVTT